MLSHYAAQSSDKSVEFFATFRSLYTLTLAEKRLKNCIVLGEKIKGAQKVIVLYCQLYATVRSSFIVNMQITTRRVPVRDTTATQLKLKLKLRRPLAVPQLDAPRRLIVLR